MFDLYELKPMALDSGSSWLSQEQPKGNEQRLYITEVKTPNKEQAQTERFTQTEFRANCVEVVAAVNDKDTVMFEPHQQPVQMYTTIEKKDIAPDKGSEYPFCYNINMLQKVHPTQTTSPTATAVASIMTDDKTCYRLDVAQPFTYNYTLVNQMTLAAAASTATFKCDICGLMFTHLSLLNNHKRIHSNSNKTEKPFQSGNDEPNESKTQLKATNKSPNCNRCGGEVIRCDHATNNKKKSKFVKCETCHLNEVTPTSTISNNNAYPPAAHSPPDSPPEIINIPHKGLHLIKRHNGMATVTKCHKCNGSGIIFIGGTKPPPNDKPFRCNVCDGSFSRYSSLWSHKRLHTGDKPFKCEMCGLTFARAAYLKNHLRVHSGEKPYKCNICGMQFSQSPHLKNHERIHSGERPYQCEVCDKTFARHSTLWNHRRIHTGEKPYRCSVCGSAFNQATHLKNHAKVHTGEKPHRCDICEVGFSDRFALKRHRLIHEKYCRNTTNNVQAQPKPAHSSPNPQPATGIEIYKSEVAFPGQQPSVASNSQQHPQQTDVDATSFQGQQSSHKSNSAKMSQTQGDLFNSDVGTSVSFSVAQQQSKQPTSEISSATTQTETFSDNINSTNHSYQTQCKQQTSDMYKYSQGQQTQQSAPQQPPQQAPPQQITQYDVGTSTVNFPAQNHQKQSSTSQQNTSLGVRYNSDTILGI